MKSIDRKETTLTRSYSSLGNARPVRLFGKGVLHRLDDSVIPESPEKGISFKCFFYTSFLVMITLTLWSDRPHLPLHAFSYYNAASHKLIITITITLSIINFNCLTFSGIKIEVNGSFMSHWTQSAFALLSFSFIKWCFEFDLSSYHLPYIKPII